MGLHEDEDLRHLDKGERRMALVPVFHRGYNEASGERRPEELENRPTHTVVYNDHTDKPITNLIHKWTHTLDNAHTYQREV